MRDIEVAPDGKWGTCKLEVIPAPFAGSMDFRFDEPLRDFVPLSPRPSPSRGEGSAQCTFEPLSPCGRGVGERGSFHIAGLVFACALLASATAALAQKQPSIVGTWEWTRKSNNCSEQYTFRDDGTASIRSGGERIEVTYRVGWSPEPNGRYKLTLSTVKDSGGQGCADSVETNGGRRDTLYALFGQSGATMILCFSLAGADCVGPLQRAR